jgi:hypothetical protein
LERPDDDGTKCKSPTGKTQEKILTFTLLNVHKPWGFYMV